MGLELRIYFLIAARTWYLRTGILATILLDGSMGGIVVGDEDDVRIVMQMMRKKARMMRKRTITK